MGELRATVGRYSITPYRITQVGTSVHCIEELCFLLQENALLLDRSICNEELVNWLSDNCGLKELAQQLKPLVHQKGSPSAFAGIILEYADYATKEERTETERLLREGMDEATHVKQKNYADYLLSHNKLDEALTAYQSLYDTAPKQDHSFNSLLLTSMGVLMARLFRFEAAADYFLEAYHENPLNEAAAIQYLAAKRMLLTPEEYVALLAGQSQFYEYSLKLETMFSEATRDYPMSAQMQELRSLMQKRTSLAPSAFDALIDEKLNEMKATYRTL